MTPEVLSYPRILGVGTATPPHSYSQQEVLEAFAIEDEKIVSVFENSAIERRFLNLPPVGEDGRRHIESQGELLAKHAKWGVDMGARALRSCLDNIGAEVADIGYLACVTTTGFLTPGFSAKLIKELGLSPYTRRLDVVGMGCNAGLNGLTATADWAAANPGRLALMVCSESCSAAYVFDGTMRTAVVNSLFGDAAAAIAITADAASTPAEPAGKVLKFASYIITDAIDAMRYDWDDEAGKFSFFLDREVPYAVGAHTERVVDKLLDGTGLRRSDIAHWIIHSGGKKVIDSVIVNLGLTRHDVRHTTSVLRDYGNLSSGSFLFSYQRLLEEGVAQKGDYGIFMTMGPGSQIETALVLY
ncbi:putative chalcone synthase [Streptomyces libani subsp. rufus]|nr:putative chalcone synthase [Streptomyces libani subsp. rufus]